MFFCHVKICDFLSFAVLHLSSCFILVNAISLHEIYQEVLGIFIYFTALCLLPAECRPFPMLALHDNGS